MSGHISETPQVADASSSSGTRRTALARANALRYLRLGLERGTVSEQSIDGWPKVIRAVTEDGAPLEAQRDGSGNYHGYPMQQQDPMATEIKRFWDRNG
ncbi:MAG: hypothetical protein OXE82_01710 [Rhodobacter sp.]|nr:hypothetical protein [Rhodobacter sp.]